MLVEHTLTVCIIGFLKRRQTAAETQISYVHHLVFIHPSQEL